MVSAQLAPTKASTSTLLWLLVEVHQPSRATFTQSGQAAKEMHNPKLVGSRSSTAHAAATHLLELDDVGVHQLPVVDDFSFHILGDLQPLFAGRDSATRAVASVLVPPLPPTSTEQPACDTRRPPHRPSISQPGVTAFARLPTLSPRSINLMATLRPVVLSSASCTKPKVPELRSLICRAGGQRRPAEEGSGWSRLGVCGS